MLSNRVQTIEAVKFVARALGDLNEQVVFVGGAVAGLYVDDPGAPEVRPTKDVDIVLEIKSLSRLEELRKALAARDIHPASEEKVMCRFKYQNIFLDIMSTHEVGWAPANPWFKDGFAKPEIYSFDHLSIRILQVAFYLASKFTAFEERGADPRTSHDFEDIVFILDNRATLINDVKQAEKDVRAFLVHKFNTILEDSSLQEAILSHLEPATQTRRFEMLIQKLKEITK